MHGSLGYSDIFCPSVKRSPVLGWTHSQFCSRIQLPVPSSTYPSIHLKQKSLIIVLVMFKSITNKKSLKIPNVILFNDMIGLPFKFYCFQGFSPAMRTPDLLLLGAAWLVVLIKSFVCNTTIAIGGFN